MMPRKRAARTRVKIRGAIIGKAFDVLFSVAGFHGHVDLLLGIFLLSWK
jgi:hypothetical protein